MYKVRSVPPSVSTFLLVSLPVLHNSGPYSTSLLSDHLDDHSLIPRKLPYEVNYQPALLAAFEFPHGLRIQALAPLQNQP